MPPGCRLNALRLFEGDGVLDVTGRLTLHSLAGSGAAVPLGARHWRSTAGGRLASTPDGVRIDITSLNGLPDGMVVSRPTRRTHCRPPPPDRREPRP